MTDPVTTVETTASTVVAEVGFVKANWGKLSAIIFVVFALGLVVGHFIL